MSVAKFALAGTALLAMGAALGTYHLNFERRTPVIRDATGYPLTRMSVAEATGCFAAKLASETDKAARHAWASCKDHLATHGALDEFNRNFGISVGSGVAAAGGLAGLGMLAGFSGRRPRHLRGPKKRTGGENYARLARILFKEAKQSGLGLNFPPGFFMSRDPAALRIEGMSKDDALAAITLGHIPITGLPFFGRTLILWR